MFNFLNHEAVAAGEREGGSYGGQKSYDNSGYDNPFGQNSNQNQRNNNFTRVDDDPFANDGKTIDISDDDLPF